MADQTLVLKANTRVNRSYSESGKPLEEVFVTADEPYLNFRFNLEGDYVGKVPTGQYEIHFKKAAEPAAAKSEKSA